MAKLAVALVACALALVTVPSASAATKGCSTAFMTAGDLKATNVSCGMARKVLRRHLNSGRAKVFGYRCTMEQFERGSKHTCRRGGKRVRFSLAD